MRFFRKSPRITPEAFSLFKNQDFKENLMIFKINGAKHSPLPSPLARPPAGFEGPHATYIF